MGRVLLPQPVERRHLRPTSPTSPTKLEQTRGCAQRSVLRSARRARSTNKVYLAGTMMRRTLSLAALSIPVLLGACSKSPPPAEPAPAPPPAVVQGATAAAEDPANLPAAGAAPAATTVSDKQEFTAMWNAAIKTLQGQPTNLAAYKGKALLVVNVASKCGLTPQYSTLEALQKKYADKGFTVVGFPCNQFNGQEPGSAEDIAKFCSSTYGVTFPMMEKIDVNGPGRHEIYKALTSVADAGGHTGDIRWNFEKFVVSADGSKITRFDPKTTPDNPAVIAAIEAALPTK
jgi:glutathione peroxidase